MILDRKKDSTDASAYKQLFTDIRDRFCVYTDVSQDRKYVTLVTVLLSDTLMSTTLPDLASIFTAEVWAINKASVHLNSIQIRYLYGLTVEQYPNSLFIRTDCCVTRLCIL